MSRGISILIHGPAKSGKTSLADTAPAPRLFLDVESGGSDFTSSKKVYWNPRTEKPPVADDTWDTAIVYVRDYDDINKAYEWLNSGQHPFKSVILDSISEGQTRAADKIAPNGMDLQKWGTLLREVGGSARKFRDLVTHPTKPLEAVVIVAMTYQKNGMGNWTPFVQGQLRVFLPYLYDMLAYLNEPIRNQDGSITRRLYTGPVPGYDAGGRFEALLPHVIDNPNITDMLNRIRAAADTTNEVA